MAHPYRYRRMTVWANGDPRIWIVDIYNPTSMHDDSDVVEAPDGSQVPILDYIALQEPAPMSGWAVDSKIRAEAAARRGMI